LRIERLISPVRSTDGLVEKAADDSATDVGGVCEVGVLAALSGRATVMQLAVSLDPVIEALRSGVVAILAD
jgi:hypothetical protein